MRRNVWVLLLFTAFTIAVTWPLILHLNTAIIDDIDGLLITWIINWSVHNFSYTANIFFPYSNTLAFSDILLPQAILAAPLVKIFGEPLLAYNFNFLLGFALTGYSVYLLANFLTKDKKTAFLAGTLFAFSTIHLNYMAHLQLFNFWPVVFSTLFLLQKRYKLFVLLFLTATLTTILFFYFLLAIGIIWGMGETGERRKIIIALAVSVLLATPFLLPYYFVSQTFHYVRPINDAIHFSFQIPDLFNVGAASRIFGWVGKLSDNTPGYLGGVFVVLVIGAMGKIRKIWKNKNARFFLILAGISFVLSLGPALHVFRDTVRIGPIPAIPLPYAILYYLVPGFAGMRTPSRWLILMAFALVMALAIWLAKKISIRKLALLVLLVLLEINWPLKFYQVPSKGEFPPEQIWLKDNYVGAPIIQFPIYGWWDNPGVETETLREYYSTIHWHPMFNGYSGFSPKEWEGKVQWLQKEFPSTETFSYLQSLGIKLVLVPSGWKVNLGKVAEFEKTAIYEIY